MEIAIARGRVLREILKQDRLSPLPITYHLAWLVAFNERLFDGIEPDNVNSLLESLSKWLATTHLTLESPRTEWVSGLTFWHTHITDSAT